MILKARPRQRNSALHLYQSARSSIQMPSRAYTSARIPTLDPMNTNTDNTSNNDNSAPITNRNSSGVPPSGLAPSPVCSRRPCIKIENTTEPVSDENIPMNFSQMNNIPTVSSNISVTQFVNMPTLPDCDRPNFPHVLKMKLEVCCVICNFYQPKGDLDMKRLKSNCLEEILSVISKPGLTMHIEDDSLISIVDMCKKNICRTLPLLDSRTIYGDDIPPITEPAWPHLNLVYQILRRILQSFANLSSFSDGFVADLLPMLQSPDQNERNCLTSFLSRYFEQGKSSKMVAILPSLSKLLENHGSSCSPPFIVGPILQLMLNIFQGSRFNNMEIMKYFKQILMLFGDYHFAHFEKQIKNIIDFFSDESCVLAGMVVRALITHWPVSCLEKEASFVRILSEVFPKMSAKERNPLINRIFSIYAACSSSCSTKVAEAALMIWTSLQIEPIIQENARAIIPLVFYPIQATIKEHWNKSIRESAAAALRTINKLSPKVIQDLNNGQDERFGTTDQDDLKKWANIARTAAKRDRKLNLGKKLAEITMLYNSYQKAQSQMKLLASTRQRASSVRQAPTFFTPSI